MFCICILLLRKWPEFKGSSKNIVGQRITRVKTGCICYTISSVCGGAHGSIAFVDYDWARTGLSFLPVNTTEDAAQRGFEATLTSDFLDDKTKVTADKITVLNTIFPHLCWSIEDLFQLNQR